MPNSEVKRRSADGSGSPRESRELPGIKLSEEAIRKDRPFCIYTAHKQIPDSLLIR